MTYGDMLAVQGLVKSYGGVRALDGAGIRLRGGEVHALVGENGAGKSTLVRILSGTLRPDDGSVRLAPEARSGGIAVVSQELSLFPDLSVRENLFPHRPPRRFGLLDRSAMDRAARPVLAELGPDVEPRTLVGELPLADKQLTEIARALLRRPRVLVLDEPTSALPAAAVDRLEQVLRTLTGRGRAAGVEQADESVGEARRDVEADEGGAAGGAGVAVGHGDDRALVDAEDVLGCLFGVHQGCQERQFGGAGVAEDAVHALASQDVEQGVGGAAAHHWLLARTGT
ncbi:ABC-type branched-subunit amino acid transport system ATPase component [Streptomyces umbrinus]|uniref:ABC-type branched-subunit amino acid transport system ATPase component n=1 Tax=Streptomyces umbrinus TaxID=67370 RepID=A0ABU0SLU1_9ACTN|nr:ABC-type branched-subunit amino acid transport system ATPase component [Streptomyces umbrinus]